MVPYQQLKRFIPLFPTKHVMFVRHCSRPLGTLKMKLDTVPLKNQTDGKVLNRKEREYRVL